MKSKYHQQYQKKRLAASIKTRLVSVVIAGLLCLLPVGASPAFAAQSASQKLQSISNNSSYEKLKNVQDQIEYTDNQINQINSLMGDLDKQRADAEQKKKEQLNLLSQRARAMYIMGNDGILEMVFASDNFAEMLSRIDNYKAITRADRDAIRNLENQVNTIEQTRQVKSQAKTELENVKKTQEDQYKKLSAEYAAENASSGGFSNLSWGNGTWNNDYMWPIDLSNGNALRITSGFGGRKSPGGIGSTNHKGVDIGVPTGTPVLAAADGVVNFAGNGGGYGNFISIDHGRAADGTTYGTQYGHLSKIEVKQGQQVKKGDEIGLSGSTGHSTGPHLHYNFLVNGQYEDARLHYTNLTFH